MPNLNLYIWTLSEPGSKLAGKWHSKQACERSSFIAEITITDPWNNEIIIADRHRRNNDRITRNNNIKKYWLDNKNCSGEVEESLQWWLLSTKSSLPVPNLKFGIQFFFNFEKRNLKNCFQFLNSGKEANFFWRWIVGVNSLAPPSFYGPYRRRSTIIIAVVIGDRYFGGDRWSLF